MNNNITKKSVFRDFHEYWYYAKYLSEQQRSIVYNSLPEKQRKSLNKSYQKGGWSDVFFRNEINDIIDELRERYGYDLIELRSKILKGKSVYLPTKFWEIVEDQISQYKLKDVKYITDGINAVICKENPKVTLLEKDNKKNK